MLALPVAALSPAQASAELVSPLAHSENGRGGISNVAGGSVDEGKPSATKKAKKYAKKRAKKEAAREQAELGRALAP